MNIPDTVGFMRSLQRTLRDVYKENVMADALDDVIAGVFPWHWFESDPKGFLALLARNRKDNQ